MEQASGVTNEILALKIDNLHKLIEDHLRADEDFQAEITETINGNGKPGIKIRLDRVEQTELGRKWNLRAIWMAILGAGAAYFIK